MDNQNILVIGAAIVAIFVFGGFFLSGPAHRDAKRPTYAVEDIRYKYQQEDLKKKKKKKTVERAPVYATGSGSSNSGSTNDASGGDNEEPSVFEHEPQEEPPLD